MYPGTGAAGGLGFAFLTFMDAQLESGIQIVIKETGLEQEIAKADLVITGEGRMDGQTIIIYNMTNEEIWKTGHCICRGCCA